MADRGVIFSAAMVRALLDGRKTQTRRLLKLPTKTHSGGPIYERKDMGGWEPTTNGGAGCFRIGKNGERIPAPETVGIWHRTCGVCLNAPYQVGDRLYVREAFAEYTSVRVPERIKNIVYRADLPDTEPPETVPITSQRLRWVCAPKPWRSSRFMPRWASRLWLNVTDVRVRRLQDISVDDADAECFGGSYPGDVLPDLFPGDHGRWAHLTIPECFSVFWNSLHTKPGETWEDNPWIVAVSFGVNHGNIDN